MKNEAMLTTPEVATRLKVSTRRVLALIQDGRLPSTQYGRDHLVKESDLKLVAERKPGRPPKQLTAPATTKRSAKQRKGKADDDENS